MTRLKNKRRGFTLVELMVTTVMVAIILPAAIKGITIVNSLARSSLDRAVALSLAESKLTELIVEEEWISGYVEGDFQDYEYADMEKYQWTLTSTDRSSVKELELTVKWLSRGFERSLTLTTMIVPSEE